MANAPRTIKALLVLLAVLGLSALTDRTASADAPPRQVTLVVQYNEVEWWLLRWNNNDIRCRIVVDHENYPTTDEVLRQCGVDLLTEWQNTPPCRKILKGGTDTSACDGLYLYLVSIQPKEREILVDLPSATATISLEGCTPTFPENRCEQLPSLRIAGEEPLPNEQITSIEGTYNSLPFACEGPVCLIPLNITPTGGIIVEFWAKSSYGDQTERYTAQVRVVDSGVSLSPGGSGWFVDVLSTQWRGERLASCAQTWEALPPVGGMTAWLGTPQDPALLSSEEAYYYLAGRLISQGVVDARACASGGLLPNGYADACGLEAARNLVLEWQNRFDARILAVAQETGVPAQLMKNLFAQESQFWPGVFRVPYEFGLGQITDHGADAILLWDPVFFEQFCPLILAQDSCDGGYLKLLPDEQAILRGALAVQAKADCADCPAGLDLTNIDFSIRLFANTLLANCDQVAQIVHNASQLKAGEVSSYEDLWRLTLANYHAGPGCVSFAVYTAWNNNRVELLWEEVATQFTPACQGVVPYVEKITR